MHTISIDGEMELRILLCRELERNEKEKIKK
jgi:hypothetical protein